MKEKIIYPELPPGYVYRKPGEAYIDNDGVESAKGDDDVDILVDDGGEYIQCLRGYVGLYEGAVYASQRRERFLPWVNLSQKGEDMSFNDALSMLVARIWMGVWE